MYTILESISANVWITALICLVVFYLIRSVSNGISSWQKAEIDAEREREKERREKEKEDRENARKEKEEANAAKNSTPDPEAEALKKELQRKERVLNLTKEICNLAKGDKGQYDQNAAEKLFELYKKIDAYEKYEKKQG